MPSTRNQRVRKNKLPFPRMQWMLIGSFVGISVLSLLMQFVLFSSQVSRMATTIPTNGEYVSLALPGMLLRVFGYSMLALLPLTTAVGILVTFRWAGPIHRFRIYLKGVVASEPTGPCELREGDELNDLCDLINQSLEATRARAAAEREPTRDDERERAA